MRTVSTCKDALLKWLVSLLSIFLNKSKLFFTVVTRFVICLFFVVCRYRIEQELGAEIKPIPPQIDLAVYCQ